METRVLQLGPYPIVPRVHGGQRRVGAIQDAYRRRGIRAEYAGIYHAPWYPRAAGPNRFPAGPRTMERIEKRPYLNDLVLGEELDQDPVCVTPLLRFWDRFRPDLIQLEHPFLWPSVKRLIETGKVRRAPVIYSSHNVESELKQLINRHTLPAGEQESATQAVRRVEEDLVHHADLVIAVSEEDARTFREWGARCCAVVRNGHDPHPPDPRWIRRWQRRLGSPWKRKRALFISSFHLPNYLGFDEMVGPHLGYLPPDAEVVVAGDIHRLPAFVEAFGPHAPVNCGRVRLLYDELSDDDMAALLQLADVVLLPITSGGGSNLKTVQALLSSRPVLAAPRAFRSFEDYTALPRVHIAETQAQFHEKLQRFMLDPAGHDPQEVTPWEPALEPLTWRYLGDRFVDHALALGASRTA